LSVSGHTVTVEDFIWRRLTGQETVYQMIELTRQIKMCGATRSIR
jgi:hypothetical protein